MGKLAIISGILGQDAAYLTEFLIGKGYNVIGLHRRYSTMNMWRLDELGLTNHPSLSLLECDITDSSSISRIINRYKPDEFYSLAALSHVGSSFDCPELTMKTNADAVINMLESIRLYSSHTKFYQASTSELYGSNYTLIDGRKVQNEKTPFQTNSPYSVSKLSSHAAVDLYRRSYNLSASAGILFNHESLPGNTAIITRNNGIIDILPIEDIFKTEKHRYEGIKNEYADSEIWNGENWTKIITGTVYRDVKKETRLIQTRRSCIISTLDHEVFKDNDSSIEAKNILEGDKVFKCKYPKFDNNLTFDDTELAKFIGFVVADGYINKERGRIRLTNCDVDKIKNMSDIICLRYGWSYRITTEGPGKFEGSVKNVYKSDINNDSEIGLWLRKNIYTEHSAYKKIPTFIINGSNEVKRSFIEGYFLGDGRKKGHEKYEYKGYSSNSSALALGLSWIFNDIIGQVPKVKYKVGNNNKYTFCCQLRSPDSNTTWRGKNMLKDLDEVIISKNTDFGDGWFYDLQTESKTFCAGPNLFKIHNSPIRGDNFVSRKITRYIGGLVNSNMDPKYPKLKLGNIQAVRDFGYSKEFVECMWLMLQQQKPKDYVVGTGIPTKVDEFLTYCFEVIGVKDWQDYVEIDKSLFRSCEVEFLCADPSLIEKELGWKSKTTAKELAKIMVEADIRRSHGQN